MQITERIVNDVMILDIVGKLAAGDGADLLRDKVASVVEQGHKKVLLNLAGCAYMDSCGLGELVRCSMAARKVNGGVKLVNLTSKISDLLAITKLLQVFDVFETEKAALGSFDDLFVAKPSA